jgi:hypothetical protein
LERIAENIQLILADLRNIASKQHVAKLELDKWERIVNRLASYSTSCKECREHLAEVETHFNQFQTNRFAIEAIDLKTHKQLTHQMVSHLQKKHNLVTEGYYLAIFMSIGLSLGVSFGLTIFDNIGLGIPIGMGIGVAIGAGLEADAKKKGRTI